MRIRKHPILDFEKKQELTFFYNGNKLKGYSGETVAAALHAAGIMTLSRSLKYLRPRGFFCGIGKCSSCLMRVNGVPDVRTCITPVLPGMIVEEQCNKELPSVEFPRCKTVGKKTDVIVVGAGPAGLSAAIEAQKSGAKVVLVDENPIIGGQLIKQTHKFFGSEQEGAGKRGIKIAEELINKLRNPDTTNIEILKNTTVFGYYGENTVHVLGAANKTENRLFELYGKKIIFACGAHENFLAFPGNDLPGVYGAGGVQTIMNVYGVKPGKNVLMVGAGNVGLIVAYQLLQAGVKVETVIEAMPTIGGYHVHAAKIRRCGVPILTSYSIKEVYGNEKVEGATIAKVDKNWRIAEGSEEDITCDTVCLAVGLTPSTRLLMQARVNQKFVPEAGGYVAIHNENMETSQPGLYVAGDASGIEEASTAMIEGRIAGGHAAETLRHGKTRTKMWWDMLSKMRDGPFGERAKRAKEIILNEASYERL
jgi:sarcosine oxidase subunit alpha